MSFPEIIPASRKVCMDTIFMFVCCFFKITLNSVFYNQLAQLGFRVIINASENDIPVFNTTRELFLHVEPMTRDTLNNIPEYAILMSRLEKAGLKDVVWAVVGGVPSRLNQVFFISLNHV